MKIKKIVKNSPIYLFSETDQIELGLHFYRLQEYYESPFKNLRNKKFTTNDLIRAYVNKTGSFTYLSDWTGFNVPSKIIKEFFLKFKNDLTLEEEKLKVLIDKFVKESTYYIIGAIESEDKDTLNHEICHGFYGTSKSFKDKVQYFMKMNYGNITRSLYLREMEKWLLNIGYHKDVIEDEIFAYLATSSIQYLYTELKIEFGNLVLSKLMEEANIIFTDFLKLQNQDN